MEAQGRSSSYARTKYAAHPSPAQRTRLARHADATPPPSPPPRPASTKPPPLAPPAPARRRPPRVRGSKDPAQSSEWRYRDVRAAPRAPTTPPTPAPRSARGWSGARPPPATPPRRREPAPGDRYRLLRSPHTRTSEATSEVNLQSW